MACHVLIHSWTFSGLLGAFLDLVIAYLLLCCSAISFFVAKFLSVFGLSLPCPCNGLFGCPRSGPCLQRLLVDCPTGNIASVQLSVKSKFPFDSIVARNNHCQLNLKLLRERRLDDGGVELEGEASYSSFSVPRRSLSQPSLSGSESIGKFDLKGKGASSQRPRCGVRRRRRGSIDYGKFTSDSSYDHMRSDVRTLQWPPSEPSKPASEHHAQNTVPANYYERTVPDFQTNDVVNGNKFMYDNRTSFECLKSIRGQGHGIDRQDENVVSILEEALEEEQAARASLYSELDQERIAAATAADEAMAMISRLQEEKASIEIEARQYQRILEEKSDYDAEEMNILKEIIIRREQEKYFLEKEVEAYKKVLQVVEGSECQVDDAQGHTEASLLDSSVDPMLMLQQISESIDKRVNIKNMSIYPDYASGFVEKATCNVSLGKESMIPISDDETKGLDGSEYPSISQDQSQNGDETSRDIEEKGALSMDEIPHPPFCESSSSPDHDFVENNAVLVGEQAENNNAYREEKMISGDDGKEMQMQGREPHVHDVHVIDSKYDICNKSAAKRSESQLMVKNASDASRNYKLLFDTSHTQTVDDSPGNSLKVELEINRSCSDIVSRFPSVGSSPGRGFVSESRLNSLSAVDQERLRIDSEIGWLRMRLRAVQEEKQKLKNSFDPGERGKTEVQLLEDVARQLREIRHLTEPEKAARQASLPPLSSKVKSKKRRSRSTSIGDGRSAST